ncbi:MAG: hypothetical protein EZS28_047955, partial [Streblomastix strix]
MPLRIPLAVWAAIPHHSITSLACFQADNRFFTGSSNGYICSWLFSPVENIYKA